MEDDITIGAFGYVENPHDKSEVLMIKRKNKPYAGYLSFPGGGVEEGETTMETVIREVKEETGVHVDPSMVQFVGYVKFRGDHDPSKSYKANVFRCKYLRGELTPGYDIEEVSWMRHEDIPRMKVPEPVMKFYEKMMMYTNPVAPIELNITGR